MLIYHKLFKAFCWCSFVSTYTWVERDIVKIHCTGADQGEGCAGGCAPPPLSEMACGFLVQLVFRKKICGLLVQPLLRNILDPPLLNKTQGR